MIMPSETIGHLHRFNPRTDRCCVCGLSLAAMEMILLYREDESWRQLAELGFALQPGVPGSGQFDVLHKEAPVGYVRIDRSEPWWHWGLPDGCCGRTRTKWDSAIALLRAAKLIAA